MKLFLKLLLAAILLSLPILALTAHIDPTGLFKPFVVVEAKEEPPAPVQPKSWTKEDIKTLIRETSEEFNVSRETLEYVVSCESQYRPHVQSEHYYKGIREDSWGLVQINLPSWGGEISKEQALDPVFSIRFLAKKLKAGQGYLWTCYRRMV